MKTLSDNWIAEGLIDFEYKKYVLLAYLKNVDEQFKEVKLYPPLSELIGHYEKLKHFHDQKDHIQTAFPKQLEGLDMKKMKLKYKNRLEDDEVIKELTNIAAYALPKIKKYIEEGKTIYDFIENHLEIEPIGISPLYQKEGYAFLSLEKSNDIYIYRYSVALFQNSLDKFRGIALQFIRKVRRSLVNTYEHIKMELVKNYADLPNPSTWRIHSKNMIPLQESLVPISKRLLLKAIEI